ncbi:MAG: chemotaxis protein CheA [Methanomicrobiales archaeon]|nr:chemotaxis protein CheA [Methanomicrobiales archaeon]
MPDENGYLKLFLVESRENHENLVKNLLILERSEDRETIDEIFRSAHTLKGMSASMGFSGLERLCHSMEDVFSSIREGSIRPCGEMVDDLLGCTDYIEEALARIEKDGEEGLEEPVEFIDRLVRWGRNENRRGEGSIGEVSDVPESQAVAGSAIPAAEKKIQLSGDRGEKFRIRIRIDGNGSAKYLRGMIILQNLEILGRIIACSPSREMVEDESFDGELDMVLESDSGAEAIRTAIGSLDISSCHISPFIDPEEPKSEPEMCEGPERKAKATEGRKDGKKREFSHLRVDIKRLDQMMNLIEDLVLKEGRIRQIAGKYQVTELDEAIGMIGRTISDLHELMMRIRMIPLDYIFNRFPRVVRDVAHHEGKDVELIITGGDVELDRSVMDGLNDPLLHLIRNAVNHGIESPDERVSAGKKPRGTVRLSAGRERDNVFIVVEDDGKGIDGERVKQKAIEKGIISEEEASELSREEIVNLLFRPGFSTAEQITDISGRGVGLDVVKKAIEALKGSIRVESQNGKGTKFMLILPPSMAIVEVLLVRINGHRCALPVHSVVEVANMKNCMVRKVGRGEVVMMRDEVIPLFSLNDMFGSDGRDDILFVLQNHDRRFCIRVGEVEGQQQVVVKPLNLIFGRNCGISGVTIPGDGEVVPVLDVNHMIQS